ncbi:unnamed protein product [Caenorhabditis angaria]|uniref:SH2 domain-containing protein n=1 Tax=Caenorhabditis angaria TaxID=860376 RepID=A0A9P1IAP7_9PELO|nr:unnamed protein product [Caenorhabditis angaria]
MGKEEGPESEKCCKHGEGCGKKYRGIGNSSNENEYVNMGPDIVDESRKTDEKIREFANSLSKDSMTPLPTYDNINSLNSFSDSNAEPSDLDTDTSYKVLKSKKTKKKKNRKNKNKKASRKSNSHLTPKKREAKVEQIERSFYLGVMTRKDAENAIGSRKRFAVYHQLSSASVLLNIQREVFLSAIYRSENGRFTHFYIREQIHEDLNHEFYVDTGKSEVPQMFATIENLIQYHCKI